MAIFQNVIPSHFVRHFHQFLCHSFIPFGPGELYGQKSIVPGKRSLIFPGRNYKLVLAYCSPFRFFNFCRSLIVSQSEAFLVHVAFVAPLSDLLIPLQSNSA